MDKIIINCGKVRGESAYEYAKEGGYTGTEAEFNTLMANPMTETKVDNRINDYLAESGIETKLTYICNIINQTFSCVELLSSVLLQNGWKFKLISSKSNINYSSTIETETTYDDSSWDNVVIPHDWSIYNNFSSSSPSGYEGGYLDGGDAWYRRDLPISQVMEGKRLFLYFDGVYMESDVYINGIKVKTNYMGYNPFAVEITEYIDYSSDNVLAVFVRNRQPSSRWYSGSGIYRNVYFIVAENADVEVGDIIVTTPKLETENGGNVTTNVKVSLSNTSSKNKMVSLKCSILNEKGEVVGDKQITKELIRDSEEDVLIDVTVRNPELWSVGKGILYKAKVVYSYDGIEYSKSVEFGYRYFKFLSDGFYLNGEKTFMKGVCMHHDLGCLGAEVNSSAMERQIDSLIKMGANAIRLTHNPSSSEFLNLCAKKGVLTIEEFFDTWTSSKKAYDFGRYWETHKNEVIENTVKRDRNNPSIMMWSIGNEIIRTSTSYTDDIATGYVQDMIDEIRKFDDRPITMGDDTPGNSVSHACMQLLDVIGINYGNDSEYKVVRSKFPDKPIYGSETTSALSSRGCYARDNVELQCSSLDDDYVSWGDAAATALKRHMTSEYLFGMFVWTGWDYIGEPTPFNKFPTRSSYFGIVDLAGFPKDIYYMYQAKWTNKPMIHLFPAWKGSYGDTKSIYIYSNCDSVELFLNGTSLGKKTDTNAKYQFVYTTSFVNGTIVANGYDSEGNIVAQDILYTPLSKPSKLVLSSDKSSVNINSDDLVFVSCDIVDANEVINPTASNSVTFVVDGGIVIGTDNGDATNVENMRSNTKKAFNGKVLCIVRPDKSQGKLTIKANSDGLETGTITVQKGNLSVIVEQNEVEFIDATNPSIYTYPTVLENIVATKDVTTYTVNDELSTDDIAVSAKYSDGSSKSVDGFTVDANVVNMKVAGSYSLNVSYTEDDVTVETIITIIISDNTENAMGFDGYTSNESVGLDVGSSYSLLNDDDGYYLTANQKTSNDIKFTLLDKTTPENNLGKYILEFDYTKIDSNNNWSLGLTVPYNSIGSRIYIVNGLISNDNSSDQVSCCSRIVNYTLISGHRYRYEIELSSIEPLTFIVTITDLSTNEEVYTTTQFSNPVSNALTDKNSYYGAFTKQSGFRIRRIQFLPKTDE